MREDNFFITECPIYKNLFILFPCCRYLDRNRISQFLCTFLLESNSTGVRWQAHSLVLALYRHSPPRDQDLLLTLMWSLWPHLPAYGRKAAQFVDLLGYFSLKTQHCEKKVRQV